MNSTLNKILILGLLFFLVTSFTGPHKTGKRIFKFLKKDQIEKLERYYIEKEELVSLINGMEPKPSEEQINRVMESYDSGKESYLQSFVENIGDFNWDKSALDSITYDYVIGKPGEDEKILWPDSKNFNMEDTDQLKANVFLFINDSENKYILKFEMLNFLGDWKLFNMLKRPYLQQLENN